MVTCEILLFFQIRDLLIHVPWAYGWKKWENKKGWANKRVIKRKRRAHSRLALEAFWLAALPGFSSEEVERHQGRCVGSKSKADKGCRVGRGHRCPGRRRFLFVTGHNPWAQFTFQSGTVQTCASPCWHLLLSTAGTAHHYTVRVFIHSVPASSVLCYDGVWLKRLAWSMFYNKANSHGHYWCVFLLIVEGNIRRLTLKYWIIKYRCSKLALYLHNT